MNNEALETRKSDIEKRFNDVQAQITELSSEVNRLQGEYRVVQDLIKELGNATDTAQPERQANSDKRTGK